MLLHRPAVRPSHSASPPLAPAAPSPPAAHRLAPAPVPNPSRMPTPHALPPTHAPHPPRPSPAPLSARAVSFSLTPMDPPHAPPALGLGSAPASRPPLAARTSSASLASSSSSSLPSPRTASFAHVTPPYAFPYPAHAHATPPSAYAHAHASPAHSPVHAAHAAYSSRPPSVRRTSSLRDPPPNATPPKSRSPSANGDERAGKTRNHDGDDEPAKRRRLNRPGVSPAKSASSSATAGGQGATASGSQAPPDASAAPHSPHNGSSTPPAASRKPPGLAPIKPIGFAAAREARAGGGGGGGGGGGEDGAIPSPVVMGFDFKSIDGDQLRTVRDTISIKEQQMALIAQRRKQAAASQPTTPKELTFKGWVPKTAEERRGGVGVRREKTKDKVERMTIVTSASDGGVVPGSKGLSSQQASPRDAPSGPQTSIPHSLAPSHHHQFPGVPHTAHPHARHLLPYLDPRGAPTSHARTALDDMPSAASGPMPGAPPGGYYASSSVRSSAQPAYDRRNFSMPSRAYPPASPGSVQQSPRRAAHAHAHGPSSRSPSPASPQRREYVPAPLSAGLGYESELRDARDGRELHDPRDRDARDAVRRVEATHAQQLAHTRDFKQTLAQANALLGNLQQSADSLQEMVRYEVSRAASAERREVDDLRERVRALEERLAGYEARR